MKIVIVHGGPRRGGNTDKMTELFKTAMQKNGEAEFTEFYMPRDLPQFCTGCQACLDYGRDKCPHAKYTLPLLDAMLSADALVFTCPCYVMQTAGAMKNFLDHFGHIFMAHRPEQAMFAKKAFILSTANAAGLSAAIKTIKTNLRWWGVNRVYWRGFAVRATGWENIKPKRKAKLEQNIKKDAAMFCKEIKRGKRAPYLGTRFMFKIMRTVIRGYDENTLPADKKYWQDKNWFKTTPFKK